MLIQQVENWFRQKMPGIRLKQIFGTNEIIVNDGRKLRGKLISIRSAGLAMK